ncbi:MAG: hypothetical protein H0U76_21915 [Ktedonobacteraceae bacterium]|nr:hypothetical protein [Ktedonobacteraceae bacterium]
MSIPKISTSERAQHVIHPNISLHDVRNPRDPLVPSKRLKHDDDLAVRLTWIILGYVAFVVVMWLLILGVEAMAR